jgi:hypothetical protein
MSTKTALFASEISGGNYRQSFLADGLSDGHIKVGTALV